MKKNLPESLAKKLERFEFLKNKSSKIEKEKKEEEKTKETNKNN